MAGLCVPGGPGVAAQSLGDLVVQRRLELRQARADHAAALAAFRVVEQRWSTALEEVALARRSGDADALQRAFALAQDRAGPLRGQDQRVEEARGVLDARREALANAITLRLEQLVAEMDAAPSRQERTELDALFRDLQNELRDLEGEAEDTFRLQPVVFPEVTFDPRDGPEDFLSKAQLIERQAEEYDSLIADTDRRVSSLEHRLRIQRQRGDLLAGVQRFDDTRLPVVVGAPTTGGVPADSAGTGSRPLTLEEQIEELRIYRSQLEVYRDQLLARAALFRRRIGAVA
jgi:hypothetical protein